MILISGKNNTDLLSSFEEKPRKINLIKKKENIISF